MIKRGHEVRAIALPPLPHGAVLPPETEISYGNYLKMNDDEVKKMFEGCDGFVFAAGVDERVEGPAPIYNLYKKYNIDPVKRLLKIAKECGVKHCVILGSYFSYFAKARPQMHLTEYHQYIRSRIDQKKVVMSFAYDNFNVAVLELTYIFGTQPGRKPVWIFLVESIRKMPGVTIEASPRLVLEGGHWCDECERKSWNYGRRAKVDPFFAQVWKPLHEDDELREYPKEVNELNIK
mgnify:FL=1